MVSTSLLQCGHALQGEVTRPWVCPIGSDRVGPFPRSGLTPSPPRNPGSSSHLHQQVCVHGGSRLGLSVREMTPCVATADKSSDKEENMTGTLNVAREVGPRGYYHVASWKEKLRNVWLSGQVELKA